MSVVCCCSGCQFTVARQLELLVCMSALTSDDLCLYMYLCVYLSVCSSVSLSLCVSNEQ